MDNIDQYIQDGLNAIDEDIKTDEEIREISRLIKDELIRNASKGVETHITDLNGNWLLIWEVSEKLSLVRLMCYNETRMTMVPKYRPLVLEGQIDDEYGVEEALEAVVTFFVSKQYGKIIVEELRDND